MAGKKILYGAVGVFATLLGVIGVWLPGLPTTPFILIALWAFSNSSTRLHRWLMRLPLLGNALNDARRFQSERAINLSVKLIAQSSAWLSFVVLSFTLRSWLISLVIGLFALLCSVFMFIIPTAQHSEASE